MRWLEEQLRCERAFNADLKARLHELETGVLSDCCDKQAGDNSRQTAVCEPRYSLLLNE